MNFLVIAAALLGLWMASQVWTLVRNYRNAKLTGLPVIWVPVDPDNVSLGDHLHTQLQTHTQERDRQRGRLSTDMLERLYTSS